MNQSKFKPTPVYLANREAYRKGWPIICNEGGTRSGKTYSIVQLLIHIALIWQPGVKISIVSRSMPHLKDGALFDFKKIMRLWNVWNLNYWNATDFTWEDPNGSLIKFIGLEDPDKAHGPGRDILYINEANFISKALYDQLSQRTTQMEFLDWNPANFNSWVYDLADDPANKVIRSTYKNNRSNLTQKVINKVESYQHLPDPFMWQVYGLGLRGASEEIIYRGWELCDEMPGKGDVVYGLDFGFVHPCAMVEVEFYEGAVYVDEKIYKSGLTKPELTELIKGIVKTKAAIYADSNEADSIEELYRNGLNIHKANKDVWAGIITVKGLKLFITRRSTNVIREKQGYKWKKDKNDKILEEPVKENDDAMDAERYAIHTHLTQPKANFWTL
jgi:phage terminase large subunit